MRASSAPSRVARPRWSRRVPSGRSRLLRRRDAFEAKTPKTLTRTTAIASSSPPSSSSSEDWLDVLRDAEFRPGRWVRCDRDARPDASLGVRAIKPYWRRGGASSYDPADFVFDASDDEIFARRASSGSPRWTRKVATLLRAAVRAWRESDAAYSAMRVDGPSDDAFATPREDASSSRKESASDDEDALAGLHPVLRALVRRKRSGSKPGARTDAMRLGLAVEGGGMKGVISASMCGELLRLGFSDCFDAVYGSSAGAMNLTYYLAGQPEGVAAYQEDLVSGEFLNLRRLPKTRRSRALVGTPEGRRPAMDVSYLVDGVMDGVTDRGLRWDKILASPVRFNVVATSLDALAAVTLKPPFADVHDLKQCLKASAAVPTLAGPEPITHRGQRLVDAAVMEPVPVHAAIADGCTHVLVLCTRTLPEPNFARASSANDASVGSAVVACATDAGASRAGTGSGDAAARSGNGRSLAREKGRTVSIRGPRGRVRFRSGPVTGFGSRGGSASFSPRGVFVSDSESGTDSGIEPDARIPAWKSWDDPEDEFATYADDDDYVFSPTESASPAFSSAEGVGRPSAFGSVARSGGVSEGVYAPPPKTFMSWALGPLAYAVIRRALLSPRHMRDAWRTHDAHRKLAREGAAPELDEALVLARDDWASAEGAGAFPGDGDASVFAVSPRDADLPKGGVGSLCTDPATLEMGNAAGAVALNRALKKLLALSGE